MALVTLTIKSDKSKGAKERIPNPGFWSHTVYLPEKPDIFRWFHILQLFFSFYAMIKIIFLTLQVIGDYLYTGRAEAAEGYSFSYTYKSEGRVRGGFGVVRWGQVTESVPDSCISQKRTFYGQKLRNQIFVTTFYSQKFWNYIFFTTFYGKKLRNYIFFNNFLWSTAEKPPDMFHNFLYGQKQRNFIFLQLRLWTKAAKPKYSFTTNEQK